MLLVDLVKFCEQLNIGKSDCWMDIKFLILLFQMWIWIIYLLTME